MLSLRTAVMAYVMDPTTLVTFIYRAPVDVRTVELLGSWDNFNLPYRMHNDRRRGSKFWSGCFKFENIVFDGDQLSWRTPRAGGLRQGGTYWYYYRINYDIDTYDDRQPHTTGCPLLPGQTLNVIEVPIELVEPPARCHSAYGDIIGSLALLADKQTMDPDSKFACLEPPPISKVHERCLSDEALAGRLENRPAVVVDDTVSPISTSCSPRARLASADSKISKQFVHDGVSRASSVYSQQGMEREPVRGQHGRAEPEDACEKSLPRVVYPDELGREARQSRDEVITLAVAKPGEGKASLQAPDMERRVSQMSIGPASIQNVQFYGSRPGTSLNEDPEQYRPRLYSLSSNLELGEYRKDAATQPHQSSGQICSRRQSEDVEHACSASREEAVDFDLVSPTFSAATISTNGQNTPFRLSTHTSMTGPTQYTEDTESLADRLRALVTRSERSGSTNSSRRSFELPFLRSKPPSCNNYALPTIASESTLSLSKTASDPAGRKDFALPSVLSDDETGRSMADDIFSELGFLSAAIA